jgi:hypothetical protein
MQNRSVFPFRRHGAKKRSKGAARRSRGPQRPLPNSARDLLPLLQPATKALAQMLAGRTGASGQLNHARNLLAHAERLIDDRMHNRLIPAEREEFFEQLARLRLTLADADAEAEVRAAEEQEEKAPPPPPIGQERLKEMALALSRPERDRSGSRRPSDQADAGLEAEMPGSPATSATLPAAADAADPARPPDDGHQDRPALKPLAELPGRLVLSQAAGDRARSLTQAAGGRARSLIKPGVRRTGRSSVLAGNRVAEVPAQTDRQANEHGDGQPVQSAAGNGAADETAKDNSAKATRRARKTEDGLPEGWVIDDEGYVVPKQG